MNRIEQTAEFRDWIGSIKDDRLFAQVASRIARMEGGNFGDIESIGDGVSELRIHYKSGYRIYFCRTGGIVYLLLCAGTKRTQKKDIKKAQKLRANL